MSFFFHLSSSLGFFSLLSCFLCMESSVDALSISSYSCSSTSPFHPTRKKNFFSVLPPRKPRYSPWEQEPKEQEGEDTQEEDLPHYYHPSPVVQNHLNDLRTTFDPSGRVRRTRERRTRRKKEKNRIRKAETNDGECSFSGAKREENCLGEKGRMKGRLRKSLRVSRVLLSDKTQKIEERKSFRLLSSRVASVLFFLPPNTLSVSPPSSSSSRRSFISSSRSSPYFRKSNKARLGKKGQTASFCDRSRHSLSSLPNQSLSLLSRSSVPSFYSNIKMLSNYTSTIPRGICGACRAARGFSSSGLRLHGRREGTQHGEISEDCHEMEEKEIEKGEEEEEVKEGTGKRRLEEGEEGGTHSQKDEVSLSSSLLSCTDSLADEEKEKEDEEKEKLKISKTIQTDRETSDTCARGLEANSIDRTLASPRNTPFFRSFFLRDLLERNLIVQGACLHQLDDLLIQWTNNYQKQSHYPPSSASSSPSGSCPFLSPSSSSSSPSLPSRPSPGGVSGEALEKSVETFKQEGEEERSQVQEPLSFYMGIDLTAGSLHAGHLLPLLLLKRLQESHAVRPVILLGSATTLVGDPSGKSEKMLTKKHKTEKPSSSTSPARADCDEKENNDHEQMFLLSTNLHSKHKGGLLAADGEIEKGLGEDVQKTKKKKKEDEDEEAEEANRGREEERALLDKNRHVSEDPSASEDPTSSFQKASPGGFFDFERFLREGEDVPGAAGEVEEGGEKKRRRRGRGKEEEELWGDERNEEERRRYEIIEENKKVIIQQLRNIFSFSSSSLSATSSSFSSRNGSQSGLSTLRNTSSPVDSSPSSTSFSNKAPSRQRCLCHALTRPLFPSPCSHTFAPPPALIVENSQWLSSVSCLSFLTKIASLIPVSHLLTRSTAQQNLQENGLPFSSLAYSLLQGLDWLELRRRFNVLGQVGGGDQWGNIATGLELARKKDSLHLFALTTPLLLLSRVHQDTSPLNDNNNKAAASQRFKNGEGERRRGGEEVRGEQVGGGTAGEGGEKEDERGGRRRRRVPSMNEGEGGKEEGRKMGKSCGQGGGGVVWLRREWTSPVQFWQYWRNVPDTDIKRMLRWFCLSPLKEIEALEEEAEKNPDEKDGFNSLKEYLADHMTRLIHGEETLQSVKAVIAAARGAPRFRSRGETASSMPVSSSGDNRCVGPLSPLPATHLLKRSAVDGSASRTDASQGKAENEEKLTSSLDEKTEVTTTLFSQESSSNSSPPFHLSSRKPLTLSSLLVKLQLCPSRAAARRLAAQGGLVINHQKIDNPEVYIHLDKHFRVFANRESSPGKKTRSTLPQSLSLSAKEVTEKARHVYKAKISREGNEKGILAIIHAGETEIQESTKRTKEKGGSEEELGREEPADEEDKEKKLLQSLVCAGRKSFAVVEIVDDADWPQDKRHVDILIT